MRKGVTPAARWPSNGAAYPARDLDSFAILRRSSHHRQLSSIRQSRRALHSANNHQGRCNNGSTTTIPSFRTPSSCLTRFLHVLKTGIAERRQFSAFTPLRGGGGFDDDDDFGSASSDISSMVRRRVNPVKQAAAMAQRKKEEEQEKARLRMQREAEEQAKLASLVHQRQLIATILDNVEQELAPMLEAKQQYDERQRLAREERERAHREWMKRYEKVVTRAASFTDIDERLFEEYYLLMYPEAHRIDSYLDELHALLQYYNAELENHRQTFRRINLASRRIQLDIQLARFAASLNSLAESLSDSVVTPHTMAKRRIDDILDPMTRFQMNYTLSQEAGTKLQNGSASIADDLTQLASRTKDRDRKRLYLGLSKKMTKIRIDVTGALHDYRTIRRLRQWFTPLGQSLVFNIISNPSSRSARRIIEGSIGARMSFSDRHFLSITWTFYHWYLPRWDEHPPRSANHSIDWKHLDVVYPFDLLYMTSRIIIHSAEEISMMLRLGQHPKRLDFEDWCKRATLMTVNMQIEVSALKYYTYLRLRTESRVSSLGDVPDTISRGLFTPLNPLSSDLRRFFLYVDTIRECMVETERLRNTITQSRAQIVASNEKSLRSPSSKGTGSAVGRKAPPVVPPKSRTKTEKNRRRRERRKAAKARLKASISAPQDTSSIPSPPIQSASIKGKDLEKTTQRRSRGTDTEKKASGSTLKPSGAFKTRLEVPKSLRTRTRSSKFGPALRRGYSTGSRALLKDEQSETAEAVSSTDDHHQSPTSGSTKQSVESENEDTIITTVSGTQVSEVISTHLSAEEEYNRDDSPQFWSYNQHKGPDGGKIGVHYCKTFDRAEQVARLFSGSQVIGFDIEWKPQALSTSGIKSNVSLIQIANAERIALFHLAVFRPGNDVHELVPPSLRELLESAGTMKVGVSIKADCSRVRRHLGIDVRAQLELSHLYKLVRFSRTQPKMVDRRTVNLSQQVEELLGLPLRKDNDVRRSDWTRPLDYSQVQYAASDAYACLCLYRILDAKRRALTPVPPMPAYAELNLPILLVEDGKVNDNDDNNNNETASPHPKKSLRLLKSKKEEDKEDGGEINGTNSI